MSKPGDFRRACSTPENESAAFAVVEQMNRLECRGEVVETHVGRPSAQRTRRKEELAASLEVPRTAARLRDADRIYGSYQRLSAARAAR